MVFFQFKVVRTPNVSVLQKEKKKIVHLVHMYIEFLMEQSGFVSSLSLEHACLHNEHSFFYHHIAFLFTFIYIFKRYSLFNLFVGWS